MANHFDALGGELGIRALVARFYSIMDTLPHAKGIRDLHPGDLEGSKEKLYLFLCGWTGGPPLYMERFGHPRLRARHLPFAIGDAERDQWMACMRQAMAERGIAEPTFSQLLGAFQGLADHMRNRG